MSFLHDRTGPEDRQPGSDRKEGKSKLLSGRNHTINVVWGPRTQTNLFVRLFYDPTISAAPERGPKKSLRPQFDRLPATLGLGEVCAYTHALWNCLQWIHSLPMGRLWHTCPGNGKREAPTHNPPCLHCVAAFALTASQPWPPTKVSLRGF